MSAPARAQRVMVPEMVRSAAGPYSAPLGAWTLLGLVGWVFLLVGGMDVGLVWYPAAFGNPAWEFGSVTAALNGLPLPLMGLALILAGASARGNAAAVKVAIGAAALALIAVLGAGVLYGLTAPIAVRSVSEPLASSGLGKAILRSAVQLVAYPVALVLLILQGRRLLRLGDRPE